jgi:hypothetical protein
MLLHTYEHYLTNPTLHTSPFRRPIAPPLVPSLVRLVELAWPWGADAGAEPPPSSLPRTLQRRRDVLVEPGQVRRPGVAQQG